MEAISQGSTSLLDQATQIALTAGPFFFAVWLIQHALTHYQKSRREYLRGAHPLTQEERNEWRNHVRAEFAVTLLVLFGGLLFAGIATQVWVKNQAQEKYYRGHFYVPPFLEVDDSQDYVRKTENYSYFIVPQINGNDPYIKMRFSGGGSNIDVKLHPFAVDFPANQLYHVLIEYSGHGDTEYQLMCDINSGRPMRLLPLDRIFSGASVDLGIYNCSRRRPV